MDTQARADAMADAETLRSLLPAQIDTVTIAPEPFYLLNSIERGDVRRSGQHAWICARAAFRAVPGLRG
jgi:hypothetical protein